MTRRHTLRTRIIIYFCVYLGILLTIYSFAISGLISLSQDFAFEKQLAETSDQIIRSISSTGNEPETLPPHFEIFADPADIPEMLREHVKKRAPGYFEIDTETLSYHVSVFRVPSTGKTFYLFFDVGSYEFPEAFEFTFNLALFGIGIFMMLAGGLLSLAISGKIMGPITSLVKTVKELSPDKPFKPLSDYHADDEIGLLVDTINDLIRRIDEFVQREREFTLFASHELRTPISVIKGAAEILEAGMASDNDRTAAPLERIRLSVKELDTLIHTFLMLARKDQAYTTGDSSCELKHVIESVVSSYRYLLDGKQVEVILDTSSAGRVSVPETIATIAVGNLIRNAFQYTLSGTVEIIGKADHIQVHDTGPGLDEPKAITGSGLGLLIVKRLCERMGWQHTISSLPDGGTRATLIFSTQKTAET